MTDQTAEHSAAVLAAIVEDVVALSTVPGELDLGETPSSAVFSADRGR